MSDPALQGIPQFEQFEIVKQGIKIGNSIVGGVAEILTIPHNLGYIPVPIVFVTSGTTYSPLPGILGFGFSAGTFTVNVYSYCYTDATNLYIQTSNGAAGTQSAYTFKYFLMRSKANQ